MLFPPLEEFVDILDLPHDEPHFKSDEPKVGNNYMYKSVASSFLLNPYYHVSFSFILGSVHPNIHLINYMENYIIFPRKINFNHLTRSDVAVMWLLVNKIETNWEIVVIQLMLGRKKKGIYLAYGDLAMNIL